MKPFRAALLAGLCIALAGCVQFFDSLSDHSTPHGLSASKGEGTSIQVSWSGPDFKEGDTTTVSTYNLYRNGSFLVSTSSTHYSDTPPPASQQSYSVTADLSDGRVTGSSNTDTGWYVPAKPLRLGSHPGRQSASETGWYKTLVTRGWTFHFTAITGSTTISIRDWENPWNEITSVGTGDLVWTSDRTKEIWLRVFSGSNLEAWYE